MILAACMRTHQHTHMHVRVQLADGRSSPGVTAKGKSKKAAGKKAKEPAAADGAVDVAPDSSAQGHSRADMRALDLHTVLLLTFNAESADNPAEASAPLVARDRHVRYLLQQLHEHLALLASTQHALRQRTAPLSRSVELPLALAALEPPVIAAILHKLMPALCAHLERAMVRLGALDSGDALRALADEHDADDADYLQHIAPCVTLLFGACRLALALRSPPVDPLLLPRQLLYCLVNTTSELPRVLPSLVELQTEATSFFCNFAERLAGHELATCTALLDLLAAIVMLGSDAAEVTEASARGAELCADVPRARLRNRVAVFAEALLKRQWKTAEAPKADAVRHMLQLYLALTAEPHAKLAHLVAEVLTEENQQEAPELDDDARFNTMTRTTYAVYYRAAFQRLNELFENLHIDARDEPFLEGRLERLRWFVVLFRALVFTAKGHADQRNVHVCVVCLY